MDDFGFWMIAALLALVSLGLVEMLAEKGKLSIAATITSVLGLGALFFFAFALTLKGDGGLAFLAFTFMLICLFAGALIGLLLGFSLNRRSKP